MVLYLILIPIHFFLQAEDLYWMTQWIEKYLNIQPELMSLFYISQAELTVEE